MIDGWNKELKIQADCISRVRGSSWDYYNDENIDDGYMVFTGVESVVFDPPGAVPNDYFGDIRVQSIAGNPERYLITIYVDSVNAQGDRKGVEVRVIATSVALEDPRTPHIRIVD